MPWSIPILPPWPDPTPLRWRNWLIASVLVMAAGAALVLLLWPHDQSTHSAKFWSLLFGAPAVVLMGMFGVRLGYYEHAKLKQDVWAEKSAHLSSEWNEWGRRHQCVWKSCVFVPVNARIDEWIQKSVALPVNLGRSLSLGWTLASSPERWVMQLLELTVERFADEIEHIKDLLVVEILLDSSTFTSLQNISFDAAKALGDVLGKRGITLRLTADMHSEPGLAQLYEWVDRQFTSPTVLIAGQRAIHGTSYSEGAVSLLFDISRTNAARSKHGVSVYRPMPSDGEALYADLGQMRLIQGDPGKQADTWHTGLDTQAQATMRKAATAARGGQADRENDALEHKVDEVVGLSGPLSGWVALGLAIQAASRRQRPQLVVSADGESPIAIVMAKANHTNQIT